MDNTDVNGTQDLAKLAEIEYPMPEGACVWVRMRIEWLREQWIKNKL